MHAMTIDALGRRQPHDPRHRRVRAADRRGLVRPAVGQAERSACATTSRSSARCSTARRRSRHDGPEISLPYRGPGSTGQGKALKSIMHPARRVPIWLASGGPKNTELCAELCDGWLPDGPRPPDGVERLPDVARPGFAKRIRPIGRRRLRDVHAAASVRDHRRRGQAVLDGMRPLTAMYVGGMGSATHNYPPRGDGAARLPRRGGAHPGALARRPQRRGDRRRSPTSTSSRARWPGRPTGSERRWDAGVRRQAGRHGPDRRRTEQLEGLELLADLAGTRDRRQE